MNLCKRNALRRLVASAGLLSPLSALRAQQAYPSRAIRLIVPYPPGGPLDIAARVLAESMRSSLGAVVVENRTGAGGNIGADAVAKAAPDGHKIGRAHV